MNDKEIQELPLVSNLRDVKLLEGNQAQVKGIYEQKDMRFRRNGDPVYRGHCGIRLSDNYLVLLHEPWQEEALRAEEEIALFEGKEVLVTGIIHPEIPNPNQYSTLLTPCLTQVTEIGILEDD